MRKFFVDSSYIYALLSERDEFHRQAAELAASFLPTDKFILTDTVLFETCSLLSKVRARNRITRFIDEISSDAQHQIIHTTIDLRNASYHLFKTHQDKEWSWVDCLSFLVMQREKLKWALTSDRHFEEAGFVALLRQPEAATRNKR